MMAGRKSLNVKEGSHPFFQWILILHQLRKFSGFLPFVRILPSCASLSIWDTLSIYVYNSNTYFLMMCLFNTLPRAVKGQVSLSFMLYKVRMLLFLPEQNMHCAVSSPSFVSLMFLIIAAFLKKIRRGGAAVTSPLDESWILCLLWSFLMHTCGTAVDDGFTCLAPWNWSRRLGLNSILLLSDISSRGCRGY